MKNLNLYTVETFSGEFFTINDIEKFVINHFNEIGTEFVFSGHSMFQSFDHYRNKGFLYTGKGADSEKYYVNCYYIISRNGKVYDPAWLESKYLENIYYRRKRTVSNGSKNNLKRSNCCAWYGFANPKGKCKSNIREFKQLTAFELEYKDYKLSKQGRYGDVKSRFIVDYDYYHERHNEHSWKRNSKAKKQWMRHQ